MMLRQAALELKIQIRAVKKKNKIRAIYISVIYCLLFSVIYYISVISFIHKCYL